MRSLMRSVTLVFLGIIVVHRSQALAAPTNSAAATSLKADERVLCASNLFTIYKAIETFQADQSHLPMWLSDLVPKYLKDINVLICPTCRRTGAVEQPPLGDPKLPCSYLFEFCPAPLGNSY